MDVFSVKVFDACGGRVRDAARRKGRAPGGNVRPVNQSGSGASALAAITGCFV